MRTRNLTFTVALVVTTLTPAVALAQSADRAAERFDSRTSRRPAAVVAPPVTAESAEAMSQGKAVISVSFALAAPVTFNTNPEHVSSGKDGDGHADPGFELAITRETDRGKLTVTLAGDMDLNFDRPVNDSTTLLGVVNYDIKTVRFAGAVPFLNYAVADAYAGQFDEHAVTIHDFTGGAKFRHEFAAPPGPAPEVIPVALSLSGSYTRRETSSPGANQHRLKGQVGVSGTWGPLGWSLSQSALFKDYTGGPNRGREDVAFITKAAISTELGGGFGVEFGAQLEHNTSNRAGQDYTAWDIGPTLVRSF